jgi:hypothetical protein
MKKTQNIWFVGFDAIPKRFSRNFSFVYIMATFVGKYVTIIGKVKDSRAYIKLEDAFIKQRGTGGYILIPSKWLGKDMRFYIFESKYSVAEIKKMLR